MKRKHYSLCITCLLVLLLAACGPKNNKQGGVSDPDQKNESPAQAGDSSSNHRSADSIKAANSNKGNADPSGRVKNQ